MTKKQPPIDEADSQLFREAVNGTRRLHHEQFYHKKQVPTPQIRTESDTENKADSLYDSSNHTIKSNDPLFYAKSGLQSRLLRQLRTGKLPIEAELDLHGLNREKAKFALVSFIETCLTNKRRVVSIIHGKGARHHAPVLKNATSLWLKQIPEVLAFCSSKPYHGGTGAVYVLLKKMRGD